MKNFAATLKLRYISFFSIINIAPILHQKWKGWMHIIHKKILCWWRHECWHNVTINTSFYIHVWMKLAQFSRLLKNWRGYHYQTEYMFYHLDYIGNDVTVWRQILASLQSPIAFSSVFIHSFIICLFVFLFVCLSGWKITHNSPTLSYIIIKFHPQMHLGLV